MASNDPRTVRTYMSFQYPVDPASIKTLVDLDLSYALASTLVNWTDSRTLTDGLATPLDQTGKRDVTLRLRPEAKWSDGTSVTAVDVVRSLERAKKLYPNDLKSLFDMVESIEAKDSRTVVFHLNRPVENSQILHKLTEPMYGVVAVTPTGALDLRKTTGPFYLKEDTKHELQMAANPFWYGRQNGMPEVVLIRQPKGSTDDAFSDDSWPNLVASSSLMPEAVAARYKSGHYSIWNRNLDRVFFISPGMRTQNADGRALFQALDQKLDRKTLLNGLSGYHLSSQFFPPGYVIFDPEFKTPSKPVVIPAEFKNRSLEILAAAGRLSDRLKDNLSTSIEAVTGHRPVIHVVPLDKFSDARSGNYDLVVVTVAVNDPNVDGVVSFFFGQTPPLIPNASSGAEDFHVRIAHARHLDERERYRDYRQVFTSAVQDGCALPLFHFSSVAIARDGIDLSSVPTSDETVSFSKVRFK